MRRLAFWSFLSTRRMIWAAVVTGGLPVTTSGCGLFTEPEMCMGPTEGEGSIDILVTPGTKPRFSWTPDCGITGLYVERMGEYESNQVLVWRVYKRHGQFESGLWFGQVPPGADEYCGSSPEGYMPCTNGPDPLIAGVEYEVTLMSGRQRASATGGWFWSQSFIP